jgi:glutathione-regulated potassium-efflux system ancillary protein KefC
VGLPWQAALVVGVTLALSSTAVAMQTMGERNILSAPMRGMSGSCSSSTT